MTRRASGLKKGASVRSVEEQQARVAAAAVAPTARAGGHRRSAGADVRRGGRHRTTATRLRPGGDRRLRGPQRRRPRRRARDGDGDEERRRRRSQPARHGSHRGRARRRRADFSHARRPGSRRAHRCRPSPMPCCHCAGPTAGTRGCACCAACGLAPTSAAPATTSSRVTSPCVRGRSSARPRWGCSPRSGASGCWCIRGRGCR